MKSIKKGEGESTRAFCLGRTKSIPAVCLTRQNVKPPKKRKRGGLGLKRHALYSIFGRDAPKKRKLHNVLKLKWDF